MGGNFLGEIKRTISYIEIQFKGGESDESGKNDGFESICKRCGIYSLR